MPASRPARLQKILAALLIFCCSYLGGLRSGRTFHATGKCRDGSRLKRRACQAGGLDKVDTDDLQRRTFLVTTVGAEERCTRALAVLTSVGLAPAVRAFERDVEDGARGCYTSHLSVYRDAVSEGLSWALIFEDNLASEKEGVKEVLQQSASWASDTQAWDVIHLSLVHSAASLRLRPLSEIDSGRVPPIVRVERTSPDWYGPVQIERPPGLGTTAYMISRGAMEALVHAGEQKGYPGTPIDDLLAEQYAGSTFAAYPAPFFRGKAASFINPDQQLFRAVMYDPSVFRSVERALLSTGLSSSQLVWTFLASMAAWTYGVTIPMAGMLFR